MLTLRMATSALLNFRATYQLSLLEGYGRNLSRTLSAMIVIVEKVQVKADEVHFLSISA